MTREIDPNKKSVYIAADHDKNVHQEDDARLKDQAIPQNIQTESILRRHFENGSIKQITEFFSAGGNVLSSLMPLVENPDTSLIFGNDAAPEKIRLFAENAIKLGFKNIKLNIGPAQEVIKSRTIVEGSLEGVTHIRLGLVWLQQPQEFVANLTDKMAKGSYLLLEELDVETWNIDPKSESFDKLAKAFVELRNLNKLSNTTGSSLSQMCVDAGLEIVELSEYQTISISGEPEHTAVADFLSLALPGIIGRGILPETEAKELLAQYYKDLETAKMSYPKMTQILAVKK